MLHEIFTDCCAGEAFTRKNLSTPFIEHGHVYASDGLIAVRKPVSCDDEGIREDHDMLASGLGWSAHLYSVNPVAVPDFTERIITCQECNGQGCGYRAKCDECGGGGVVECDYGHEHDCDECDGEGSTERAGECPECKGKGSMLDDWQCVPIDGRKWFVASKYARILRRHGAVLHLPLNENGAGPIRFTIPDTDIEGLVRCL